MISRPQGDDAMRARLRSWWQKIRKPSVVIAGIALPVGVLMLLILIGYRLNWTGFLNKTLWDWMQLLIIPAVLAIGGYVFNLTTSRNEQKSTQLRDQTEREIASDNQREAALQAYIDKMSELLLEKKLRESAEDDEVRKIARVSTLTVLPRLDNERKRSILQFLYESSLLDRGEQIVDLAGAIFVGANLKEADLLLADLREANLREANLTKATLAGANLTKATLAGTNLTGAILVGADLRGANLLLADLREADLREANLLGANLRETNLTGAYLTGAYLRGATVTLEQLNTDESLHNATLFDGSKHP
jgi:Pentapeptide repeats (8 copies)